MIFPLIVTFFYNQNKKRLLVRATSFVCLLFKVESIENDAVLSLNCEDTAGIVILIVPVARSDLNKYFLACKLLEEGVLICTRAVESEVGASIGDKYVGVVRGLYDLYGSLYVVNFVRVLLVVIKVIDVFNIFVLDEIKVW